MIAGLPKDQELTQSSKLHMPFHPRTRRTTPASCSVVAETFSMETETKTTDKSDYIFRLKQVSKEGVLITSDQTDAAITEQLHKNKLAPMNFDYISKMPAHTLYNMPKRRFPLLCTETLHTIEKTSPSPLPDVWIAKVPGLTKCNTGVFAVDTIPKDQVIGYVACGMAGSSVSYEVEQKIYLRPLHENYCMNFNYQANWVRFLNGSQKYSNVSIQGFYGEPTKNGDKTVYFPIVATKDIEPGEQLLLKYEHVARTYFEMGRPGENQEGQIENPKMNTLLFTTN